MKLNEIVLTEGFGDWLLRKLRMRWGQVGDKVRGSVVADYLYDNTLFREETYEELASHTYELKTIDPATAKKYRAFSDANSSLGFILDPDKENAAAARDITMDSLIKYPPVIDLDGYIWDGNHRVNRAIQLEIPQIPVLIQVN